MKFRVLVLLSVLALSLQAAQITNGSFETGDLTGWTVTGNVFPVVNPTTGLVNVLATNQWGTFAAQDGTYFAEISNSPAVNTPPIHDFSSLSTGTFFINPGATLSFTYDFLTNEFTDGLDYAQVVVLGSSGQVVLATYTPFMTNQSGGCTITPAAAPDGSTVCAETGWTPTTLSLSAFAGQNVRFAFQVFDSFPNGSSSAQDNGVDSVLLLDAVSGTGLAVAQTIPEPTTFLLCGAGIAAALLRVRKSRKA